jgi:digeranylgeranylglycerophospholipid reductase
MDVIIIGGGPVGLHAARSLASSGFEIEVLEEHSTAGEPVHCTGILSPAIFKEFNLLPAGTLNELRRVQFHSPKGQVIRYQTNQVEAVVVDRAVFDRNLKGLACASGAQVHEGIRAERIENLDGGIVVHCADGRRHEARACILATGSSYALHRDLGMGFPPVFLNCAQAELPTEYFGEVEIYVGSEVAPKGFAWVVPVKRAEGRFARVGLMCDGNAAAYFNKFLSRLNARGIPLDLAAQPRQRMLPLAPIQRTYGNRFLVVGDAAGVVKPTTGGGVFYGMISAGIAADVLATALRRGRLTELELSRYQKLWQQRLMEEIEAQLTLRLLMQRLTDDEIETVFDLWATDGLMPLIRKTAAFNHHRKFVIAMTRYPAMREILFRKTLA